MSVSDSLRSLTDNLNKHLVRITGRTLTDFHHKDVLGNKFNLTLFVCIVVITCAFLLLTILGLTYGCCCAEKNDENKRRKFTFSSKYKGFNDQLEMTNNDTTATTTEVERPAVTTFK